ncbi:MAG TPA: signal peptide peptidase SppA [Myxococcaceae bacterium]|nr:signal peptide peptidase SppA [Myxococcaceae bacterium]
MRIAPILLLVLLPGLTLAQTRGISAPRAPGRDVTLPPTSLSLVDDPTALSLNPAALTFTRGPQLQYFHEIDTRARLHGDALYAGTSLFGALGLAVGHQWMSGGGGSFFRQTSVGLSLGSQAFSLGATLDTYSGNDDFGGLTSWDLGIAGRPFHFLSYGLVVRNVGAPGRGTATLERSFEGGIGVRPFASWDGLLAVDYALTPTEPTVDRGVLTYTVQAPIVPGLNALAGVSHGLQPGVPFRAQAGLSLDARALGATYAVGGHTGGLHHTFGARLGGQGYPAVSLAAGTVALFDLPQLMREEGVTIGSLLGLGQTTDPFLRLMRLLEHAERDPQLRGIILRIDGSHGMELARALELSQALRRLRAGGKKIAALILRADDPAYLIASAADRVWVTPESTLFINGLSASLTHLGGAMEKLGVSWDVARQGRYKTAPEQLAESAPSEAQLETVNALLDDQSRLLVERIAASRGIPESRVMEAFSDGLLTTARAVELGLVDEILIGAALDKAAGALVPGAAWRPNYQPLQHRRPFWGAAPRIAIIPVIGSIVGGDGGGDPFGVQTSVGARPVIEAIERAAADPGVRAIVLRIDSPGGDGLASDLMYRAVLEARKRKPVIASMGDVAASGGYYVAMGAHEIHALPTTVTGSIGVFLVKPAIEGLGQRLGVSVTTLKRAPHADLLSLWEPWDEAGAARAQAWIDAFYDSFITEVARSRNLDKDAVDAAARGRVWSGVAAQRLGLVDQLGDLSSAIAAARHRAKIAPHTRVELVIEGEPPGLFMPIPGAPDVLQTRVPSSHPTLPPAMRAVAQELGAGLELLEMSGVQARLPFGLEVR